MAWEWIVWIVIYFMISWIITDACDFGDGEYIEGLIIFIGWPIVLATLFAVIITLILFKVFYSLIELVVTLIDKGV